MTNETIAESVTSKLALSAAWANLERLRLIDVGFEEQLGDINDAILRFASDKRELKAQRYENFKLILAVSLEIDKLQGQSAVSAVAAPEEPKKTRSKKTPPPQGETSPPAEKHPCHLCEDVFFHKVDLVRHLRTTHGLSMEESVKPAPIRSICANCISPVDACQTSEGNPSPILRGCPEHRTEPDEDQVRWRDSTCEEWRACPFTAKCFGPSNEEDPTCFKADKVKELGEAALAGQQGCRMKDMRSQYEATAEPRIPIEDFIEEFKARCGLHPGLLTTEEDAAEQPCWNSSCAWSDLAQDDHCDAEDQFRQGRPVAECKCFINGIGPTKGQDAAACFNTNCPSNDPSLPTCCEEWSEVWECPQVVTAGWGAVKEEEAPEAEPVDTWRAQHDAIIKAAIAAGDDINEHGVFRNPEVIEIPLPPKKGFSATIEIAVNADGGFHYGYEFKKKDHGTSGAPSVTGKAYLTRATAIKAAVEHLMRTWPEAWTEAKLKAIRNAVADFMKSILVGKEETIHEAATQEAGPEGVEEQQESAAADVPDAALESVDFIPLDEPMGDCELCQGYGVIDGELYGEFKLMPCTCVAGDKVAGRDPEDPAPEVVQIRCINNQCASHVPAEKDGCSITAQLGKQANECCNYIAAKPEPPELELCANGSCTATGKDAKEVCLRIGQLGRAPQDCKNFVPVDQCKHHMLKRSTVNGATVCDLCGFVLRTAEQEAARLEELAKEATPALTPLQQRCVHPKVFREETEAGVVCKACRLNLTQPSLL